MQYIVRNVDDEYDKSIYENWSETKRFDDDLLKKQVSEIHGI